MNFFYTLLVEGPWDASKQNCIFNSIYSPLPWLRLILFFGHFRPILGSENWFLAHIYNSTVKVLDNSYFLTDRARIYVSPFDLFSGYTRLFWREGFSGTYGRVAGDVQDGSPAHAKLKVKHTLNTFP